VIDIRAIGPRSAGSGAARTWGGSTGLPHELRLQHQWPSARR
jgi:hypothetical protein